MNLIESIMPPKNSKIMLGVSMGSDSLAAAIFLRSRGYKNLNLFHFNHKIRPQNDLMAGNFIKFCDKEGFDYVYRQSEKKGGKTEDEAFKLRNESLVSEMNTFGASVYISGHHLDDFEESYWLNAMRGHPEYFPMPLVSESWGFKKLRPFLLCTKGEMKEFILNFEGGKYAGYVVEDESNKEIKGSRRNYIRNQMIPSLLDNGVSMKQYCRKILKEKIENIQS